MTDLHDAITSLGRIPLAEQDLHSLSLQVCRIVRDVFPQAADVSLTVLEKERPHAAAALTPLALDLDEYQYAQMRGPCVDGAVSGTHTLIRDMREEKRWPDYTAFAVERGALSSMGFPVPLQRELVSAIDVYATVPHAFDEDDVASAQELAGYVGTTLANLTGILSTRRAADALRFAMESRAVIEQAKGVLMGEHRITADEAFDLLVGLSQAAQRPLRDVSQQLVQDATAGS